MNVIVDTSVWSGVLRKASGSPVGLRRDVEELIREGRVVLLGPIRQELLSGLRNDSLFLRLRDALRPFPDHTIETDDFEEAAVCFNRCRGKGIQGSNTDFLICAVAIRHRFEIFTSDRDFERFAKVLPLRLHAPRFGQ